MDENSGRSQAAQHILNQAEALFTRYGYDKTTLDDVARAAGISRSTLYQHWKKKEALFGAVLWRALRAFTVQWLAHIDADPQGGTFAGMFRIAFEIILKQPFMLALYKNDMRLLGSYMQFLEGSQIYVQRQLTQQMFLAKLQQAGLVRADLDVEAAAYAFNCLNYGLLKLSDMIPAEVAPAPERILETVMVMVERMVAPPQPGDPAAGQAIIREFAASALERLDALEQMFKATPQPQSQPQS
ncbi:MAG: TetR/AcrR family transcriptional regulator [Anaerolineae bacterium]|nr:TetR/AcrR family transcriptional regulator [Anaerolineae bacterium]